MWMRMMKNHLDWIDLGVRVKRRKALQAAAAAERNSGLKRVAPVRSIRLADRYSRRPAA